MKKIILLLFTTLILNAIENNIGYTLNNADIKDKTSEQSKQISKTKYKEEVLITSIEFDENNDYWYKTKYGYIYGKSITTDIRYVTADLLHIRTKPSLKGVEISYFLKNDKVIVIDKAKKADGFNWVFTTEGYISSDYLTTSLVKDIRYPKQNIKMLIFRQKASKNSIILKSVPRDKIKFIVKKAIKIDLTKSIKEIKEEQRVAVLKNNIVLKQKKEIIAPIKKIKIIKKKKVKIKEIIFSLNSLEYKISKIKNNFTQSKQIGETISKDGKDISIQVNINLLYLPKSYLLFSSYEYITYTMREKQNILFGTKKILNISDNNFSPYIQAGIGISLLKWTKDPLTSSTSSTKKSTSLYYALEVGSYYYISKSIDIEFSLSKSFQDHTTNLTVGIQDSKIEDKSSSKITLGLRYKF